MANDTYGPKVYMEQGGDRHHRGLQARLGGTALKIRMKTTIAGPVWQANAGAEVERPDEEAQQLIDAGAAERISGGPVAPAAPVLIDWDRDKLAALTNADLASVAEGYKIKFEQARPTKKHYVDAIMAFLENGPEEDAEEDSDAEGDPDAEWTNPEEEAAAAEAGANPDDPAPREREAVNA